MNQHKVAVVGASGYSGEELVRLLIQHPAIDLVALTSRQHVGEPLAKVYPRFAGQRYGSLKFSDSKVESIVGAGAHFAFLALPHGVAAEFARPLLDAGLRVLDLSADFRIKAPAVYETYYGAQHAAPELAAQSVYGLPEVYREKIRDARLVACPGCYPTSVILPLHPLLARGVIDPRTIVVSSMSGVSGAGRNIALEYLFAECNESVRAYGVPRHRHLGEIEQELGNALGQAVVISFTPHLVPITRGIYTTIFASLQPGKNAAHVASAFEEAYGGEQFIRLLGTNGSPDTKHVARSNFLDLAWRIDERTQRVVLLSAEDNLVKGAAGQAVQCLNVMGGWPESSALL